MKIFKKFFLHAFALSIVFIFFPGTAPAAEIGLAGPGEEAILVGRISHIEGQLLRFQPGDETWTPTLEDTPFGAGEGLYTEGNSRAEIILPNSTWARFDAGTQIQLIELRDDLTDLDLGSGTGRFYNNGAYSLIKVRTVFGDVAAPAETEFDLHVYSNAVEVIALKGSVSFTSVNTDQRFEVTAGLGSIVADSHTVSVGKGYEPPGWAAWNRERDALWAARMTSGEVSAAYLPPSLRDEAYVLDENGLWERAYYDNGYYYFWRPTHVAAGWAPFTVGCWSPWYHESTWVPYEPFGYVTHHYGNWVFIGNSWYWAPPVAAVRPHVRRPLFNIGFAWYPGRVAWIHFGTKVGWVPLAPHEPYYAHRRWGHRVVVVRDANVADLNVSVTHYKNYRHGVVIDRNDLYRVKNYRELRLSRVDKVSTARNYHVVPTLGRIATRPIADTRNVHNPAKDVPKSKSYFMSAEKTGFNRLERAPGVEPPAGKIKGSTPNEGRFLSRQEALIPPRNAGDRVIDSAGPNVIKSPVTRQYKTIEVKPRGWGASATVPKQGVTQTSLRISQSPAARVDPRRAAPEVSRASSWPMWERSLSKPTARDTLSSKYQGSSTKWTADEAQARSKQSFFGAKGVASENRKGPEQRQQTQVTTQPRTYEAGNGSKAFSGTGRPQPSSRGSMDGNNRSFFRK
jgi:hypothetical protein